MADYKRTAGACVVKLYDKGCKYAMAYPGHAHKFTAAKVHKAQRWRCYRVAVSSEQVITSSPDQGLIDAIEYRDLPGGGGGYWSVAHYPDASQTIELTDWAVGAGTWEEIDDPDYTGKLLHQRDSTATSGALTTSVITSNFTLPANPYIVLNLWRAEPPKDADRITYEPYTRIGFGLDADEFALVIPYGGEAPFVEYYEPADAKWHRLQSEGGNQLPAVEGITKGQRLWITIRVLLGKLVVSFSRSQNEESGVCYKLPSREWKFVGVTAYNPTGWTWVDKQPGVKTGPIKVVHNAGQIAVRWWPLYCPTGAQYLWYLGEQESGYTCWNTAAPGVGGGTIPANCQMLAANCDPYYYPVWEYDPVNGTGWATVSTAPAVAPYNPQASNSNYTAYSWNATITAVQWVLGNCSGGAHTTAYYPTPNSSSGDILHCQSPVLRGLQVRTRPYVATLASDWPDATDITEWVRGVNVAFTEGSPGGVATLQIDETKADLTISPNQLLTIEMGYTWEDGVTRTGTVFVGYVGTPGEDGIPGPRISANVVAYDPCIRLRDERAQDMEPDFQTFSPKDAIDWLLARAGFADDQMSLDGSTTPMYMGPVGPNGVQSDGGLDVDNDALVPAFGSELLASVVEFCRRDNESEWWIIPDATYMFQLVKRNGQLAATDGTLRELKEDGPEAIDPTAPQTTLRALSVSKETLQMDSGEYADCVVQRTTDPDGNVVHQTASYPERWYDKTDEDWSGGWRHMYCEDRDAVQSDSSATVRAAEILAKRGKRPTTIRVDTDVCDVLVKGDRVHVTNATAIGAASRLGVLSTVPAPLYFRVVGYEHNWDGKGTWPKTTVRARSIDS